eukprot:3385671-Pyramimonas_sp.AAC.1
MRHSAVQVRFDVLSDGASADDERLARSLKLLLVARALPAHAGQDSCPAHLLHRLREAKSVMRVYPGLVKRYSLPR